MNIKDLKKRFFFNYHTIKKMRYKQVLWRIFFLVKKKLLIRFNPFVRLVYCYRYDNVEIDNEYRFFCSTGRLDTFKIQSGDQQSFTINEDFDVSHILQIVNVREFCFLNKKVSFLNGVEWQSQSLERLWLYNLHYFDYAFDLGLANIVEKRDGFFQTFKILVVDWINKNMSIGCGVGWEPYPLSLRIVNWIYSYNLFSEDIEKDKNFKVLFLKSIALQVAFLNNNIEYYASRNHLIKNAKALFLAGLFFKRVGSKGKLRLLSWEVKGRNILIKEIQEQVLDDGGHYERCPMYHMIVLQDYMEMYILSKRNNVSFHVESELRNMFFFLMKTIHPDGQIALFNDSAFGIAKEPAELLDIGCSFFNELSELNKYCKTTLYSFILKDDSSHDNNKEKVENVNRNGLQVDGVELENFTLLKDSGFAVIRSKSRDQFFIISCMHPSPSFLPGHSHSDIFSYELSLRGKRFFVDSGANNYLKGEMRDYFRSSRAHNTVSVNGVNQSELWGTFGVARRAVVQSIQLLNTDDGVVLFESSFSGFPELSSLTHKRSVFFIDDQFWVVLDCVGSGIKLNKPYNIESYIHIHPERDVKSTEVGGVKIVNISDREVEDELNVVPMHIADNQFPLCDMRVNNETDESWFSTMFGDMAQNSVIVFSHEGGLPVYMGYLILPQKKYIEKKLVSCKLAVTDDIDFTMSNLHIEIILADYSYDITKCKNEICLKKSKNIS